MIEQIPVKLHRDFRDVPLPASVVEPAMGEVWTNQDQFQGLYFIHMISHHAHGAFCTQDEVQFKFIVIMQGEVESTLFPLEHREAVFLGERYDFTQQFLSLAGSPYAHID